MSGTPERDKLDQFLDRTLGPEESRAVERRIDANPDLAREAELQRWVDNELDEMFAYDSSRAPTFDASPADLAHADHAPIRIRARFPRALALAAAIVLAAVGIYTAILVSRPAPGLFVSPDAVYTKLVSRGFTPDFVCTTDDEFKAATQKRVGSPLLLAAAPNIQVLGWAYNAGFRGKIIGDRTMMLLTRVDSKEVLVMMDVAQNDRALSLPPASNLKLHRRQVGPIITYEVSTFDTPRVIDKLRIAD